MVSSTRFNNNETRKRNEKDKWLKPGGFGFQAESTYEPRLGVHHVQVVDELREVLDGVDVVVGGGGDQRHASLGVAVQVDPFEKAKCSRNKEITL